MSYLPIDGTGRVNPEEHRLSNTLNVSFVGLVGADVLAGLERVAATTGSACHAGRVEDAAPAIFIDLASGWGQPWMAEGDSDGPL